MAALEKKSEPTMERAVDMLPEKRRLVKNVTEPAMTRHIMDLTRDGAVVSVKAADSPPPPMESPWR